MSQAGNIREYEQQSPARRQIGIFHFASAHAPDDIHECDHCRLHQEEAEKRVSETTMVGKTENGIFEISENIDIRGFSRQGHCGCGQRRLTIEPGTRQAGAGQKVGNRFQSLL